MKIQKRQEIEFFGTKTGNANSIALGYATETKNFGEVAVGVMNKSTAAKDPNSPKGVCVDSDATLFSVGCGGSGERKNALEVKGDGSVLISGENGDINVADKIKQALDTDASIELVKSADSDLQYTLMVNNESRGSINIPKDQFLKNVTYDTEAKQLVFTFVTLDEEEHVERISINDLKDVYTAGNGINIDNNVISADFSSVMTAISDEKTQRETTDNEIKSTLDTKADKEDVINLENYCFRLGNDCSVAAPYKESIEKADIIQLNNNGEYMYADVNGDLNGEEYRYIYDENYDESIEITKISEEIEITTVGDFFKTDEPLDLTHTFYLDNEQTGAVENLTQLTIKESNIFVNLPYVEVNDNINDDETPQYIYDATDNKWIMVVKTYYIGSYVGFNTEEPLDLTDRLYYSNSAHVLGNWTIPGYCSTSIGYKASAYDQCCTAIGFKATTGGNYAIALGNNVPNTKSIFGVGFNGVNGIDMDRDNYGLYLKGFGGYDGTNLVVKSGDTETLNPNIKSVQQIINEKPDASAIPTKLSDLENDKVNITTSKDETSYSLKIDYKDGDVLRSALRYKPYVNNTNIAEFGLYSFDTAGNRFSQIRMRPEENKDDGQYVIHVQNVNGDTVNKVSSISTTGFDNQNYENGTAVLVESDKLEFYVNSNGFQKQLTMNKDGITKKDGKATEVFAADGTLFDLTTKADTSAIPTKTSQLTNDSSFATEDYVSNSIEDFKTMAIIYSNKVIYGLFNSNNEKIDVDLTAGSSIIIGFDNTGLDTINCNKIISIGNDIIPKGSKSVYIGESIDVDGYNSIAIGRDIRSNSNKTVIIGSNGMASTSDGYIGIGYDITENTNAIYQIAGHGGDNQYSLEETLTYDNQHKKYIYGIGGYDGTNSNAEGVKSLQEVLADKADASSIPDVSTKADLVDGKLKADQLPKLDNIAAATTTEDMITKFNALLTDLKAKGYMTADITA